VPRLRIFSVIDVTHRQAKLVQVLSELPRLSLNLYIGWSYQTQLCCIKLITVHMIVRPHFVDF